MVHIHACQSRQVIKGCLSLSLIKLPHFCVKTLKTLTHEEWRAKASDRPKSVSLEICHSNCSREHHVSTHCCIFSTKDSRCKPKYCMFNKPFKLLSPTVHCQTVHWAVWQVIPVFCERSSDRWLHRASGEWLTHCWYISDWIYCRKVTH